MEQTATTMTAPEPGVPNPLPSTHTALQVGYWFINKYRTRFIESGGQAVATQLRKQGVPAEITQLMLFGK